MQSRTSDVHTTRRRHLATSFISGKQCAPGRALTKNTCFTKHELQNIARAYNNSIVHTKGGTTQRDSLTTTVSQPHTPIHFTHRTSVEALWNQIHKKMTHTSKCHTEKCWTKQFSQTKHLGGTAFRPNMPSSWRNNQNEWLSTTDIEMVLKQYETSHPHFHFVGAVPVDFASPIDSGEMGKCVTQALCNCHVKKWIQKDVYTVGVVFNLDPHYESGSHWVGLFIDLQHNRVLFYDSFGSHPPYEIHTFMQKIASQLEDVNGTPCLVKVNTVRHQFKNTECGVYSIHFISSMLNDIDYDTFISNGLNDKQMAIYRQKFYNTLDQYDKQHANTSKIQSVGGGSSDIRLKKKTHYKYTYSRAKRRRRRQTNKHTNT